MPSHSTQAWPSSGRTGVVGFSHTEMKRRVRYWRRRSMTSAAKASTRQVRLREIAVRPHAPPSRSLAAVCAIRAVLVSSSVERASQLCERDRAQTEPDDAGQRHGLGDQPTMVSAQRSEGAPVLHELHRTFHNPNCTFAPDPRRNSACPSDAGNARRIPPKAAARFHRAATANSSTRGRSEPCGRPR